MNVTKELAALKTLRIAALRARYAEAFGETTNAGNRDFLIKRILWRLQSQFEGTLSQRAQRRAAELADECYLRTTIPKQRVVTESPTAQTVMTAMHRADGSPAVGTVLTRQYKGRLIQVAVLTDGFEFEGERYTSLSAVAKVVTGSHWNGRLFFNLKPQSLGK